MRTNCEFLRKVVAVAVLLPVFFLACGWAVTAHAADDRPNIFFAIADDWGWPHAGAYGEPVVETPTFDAVAQRGVLFTRAHTAAPSCTASRGSILTGQAIWRLEEGGNLWSRLPGKFSVYPDELEEAGYVVGKTRKGWGPGTLEGTGRSRNPAGPNFRNFEQFLETVPDDKPFCFWFGSSDPHRPYKRGSGRESGMDLEKIRVPGYLPDTPTVRGDVADYFFEVQRFDREVGEALERLDAAGRLENTLVIITGDNGMPFPKAKATCYDAGTHVPLAVCWPAKVPGNRVVDDYVDLSAVAPTVMEAAGLEPLPEMTGRSFLDVLLSDAPGRVDAQRDWVVTARERHTCCRPNDASYPIRTIFRGKYHLIWNMRPELWPAGNPPEESAGRDYGDIDGSPTFSEMRQRKDDPAIRPFFEAATGKRPEFELFDLEADPCEMQNLAGKADYAEIEEELRTKLEEHLRATGDPRMEGETDFWDTADYVAPYGRHPN